MDSEEGVHLNIPPIIMDVNMSSDFLAEQISKNLQESNKELIFEIISALGPDKTLQYYNKTRIIEQQGGLFYRDGSCRKKPGGVFFHIIHHDPSISASVKPIFANDSRKQYKQHKSDVKERRKKHTFELKKRLIQEGLLMVSNDESNDNK